MTSTVVVEIGVSVAGEKTYSLKVVPIRWENRSQTDSLPLHETDSRQADWDEIARWLALADIAFDRWSKPTRLSEVEDREKAA